jgi:Tol biopolymer transport system component
MKILKLIFYVLGFSILAGCSPKINYSLMSVPEEGGIRFTQYTKDEDIVLGPKITKVNNRINWYAPPLIALSPDGAKLAYLGEKNSSDNIYIKSTLGGGSTVQRTFRNTILDMSFSPDGKKIAFTEVVDGNDNIYVINATEGSAIQQITATPADEMGPQYSIDGNKIFFTKGERTMVGTIPVIRYYIWSFDSQTSLFTQYSEGFTPSMLPDGQSLVVTRHNKDTNLGEIWMINIEKGQETLLLADKNKGFSSPQVSPDGKMVTCVGTSNATKNRAANLDIYLFKIDGTALSQLTFHPGDDVSPKWAPDGKSIFFISQRGTLKGQWNVWQMNVNQL